MTLWRERKYQTLLAALVMMIIVYPALRVNERYRLILDYLATFLFAAALFLVFDTRRHRFIGLTLGIPTVMGIWLGYLLPDVPRFESVAAFHLLAALFFLFTLTVIIRDVHRERAINSDAINGALCGYLIIGLLFGHVFSLIEWLEPGAFRGINESFLDDEHRHITLTYFSFVALTTVGYGDIVPSSAMARGFAVVVSISGQFYLTVLVADLIGKRLNQRIAHQNQHPPHSV